MTDGARKFMEKRHYTFQGADFLLEPFSDAVG